MPEYAPVPIQEAILKVRSKCNLACPHCYVYSGPDQSWQDKPPVMSMDVMQQAAVRVGEHAEEHNLKRITTIFHGGEPLMNGPQYFREAAALWREAMPTGTTLDLGVQTNGVLLEPRMLGALLKNNIRVGVSLDGAADLNDQRRPFKNGRGSFEAVSRGLRLLGSEQYRSIFSGILCTIDPDGDPIETYNTVMSFEPPNLDFLLPHATWDSPPPRPTPTPVGDWLNTVMDHWRQDPSPAAGNTRIRLFDSVIGLLIGRPARTEQIGLSPAAMVVIETDGTYEGVDTLKIAYDGAPATGLNVNEHSLNDVLALPSTRARQLGLAGLGQTCQECPLVQVCGGGNYSDRYSTANGFMNPSVHCDDLKVFIEHAYGVIQSIAAPPS